MLDVGNTKILNRRQSGKYITRFKCDMSEFKQAYNLIEIGDNDFLLFGGLYNIYDIQNITNFLHNRNILSLLKALFVVVDDIKPCEMKTVKEYLNKNKIQPKNTINEYSILVLKNRFN
jgi:hypothetical protein